jgi:hypothetical protein
MGETYEFGKVMLLLYGFAAIFVIYAFVAIGRIWMYTRQTAEAVAKVVVVLERVVKARQIEAEASTDAGVHPLPRNHIQQMPPIADQPTIRLQK